ncbi:hypothetical protein LR48_Vigan10g163400 [Vigna angularis]|uniref:Uncharacterized protein n=1 Tax=Phaseolus angularis TaxID=3914 RepID=A0A0L9VLG7_PHAAN|nr:hypothetical protein LR48_Vigan10g163400 [Vigna angularis]
MEGTTEGRLEALEITRERRDLQQLMRMMGAQTNNHDDNSDGSQTSVNENPRRRDEETGGKGVAIIRGGRVWHYPDQFKAFCSMDWDNPFFQGETSGMAAEEGQQPQTHNKDQKDLDRRCRDREEQEREALVEEEDTQMEEATTVVGEEEVADEGTREEEEEEYFDIHSLTGPEF